MGVLRDRAHFRRSARRPGAVRDLRPRGGRAVRAAHGVLQGRQPRPVVVAANPGWYTLPEWRKDKVKDLDPFPYSLVGARVGDNELRQALPKRFLLLIGGKDEDPDDENLSAAAQVKKQGDTIVDRGENFFKAVTTAASDLGVKLGWELTEVPDVQQDAYTMSRISAEALYWKK